ncbi:T9SS type A sorting domain-containing protein [uncultured Lacinutrix sp.]|uniref:T9SS type A sorting domain-containing protein n=1 Tax=uncultured Lacinutrix sp. TaxID=574032 RepID=UPI002604C82C|nr:T9SS type A sorting domain-containing protein [uncultured Lacinutrix sp.]
MKKIYLITLLLSSAFMFSQSKDYSSMIKKGTYTVQEIQDAAETYFEVRGKGKGTGYKQYKRWEYQALRSTKENGVLKSTNYYYNELENYNNYRNQNAVSSKTSSPDPGNWEQLGPYSFNATSGWNPGTGRITSLAFENGNENHIIVGAETGGVWKTTDGGANWLPLSDNYINMKVYSLAMHPTNPSIYFWGSDNGTIFKSIDAGVTWNLVTSSINTGEVNKILIDPNTPTKMYCSVEGASGGLYKSINSGVSWSLIHPDANERGYDFEFKPTDPSVVYASGRSVFKSIDGGDTFTKLAAPNGVPNFTTEYVSGILNWKSENKGFEHFGVTTILPKTGDRLGLFAKVNAPTSVSGDKTKIITPSLNLSTAINPVLKFSYALPEYFGAVDVLKVYYKTSEAGAWVQLVDYTVVQNAWVDITLNLPNPTADYYVAFEGEITTSETYGGGGVNLDDISVEDASTAVFFSDGFESATPNVFGTGAKMLAITENDPSVVYLLEANGISGSSFKGIYKSTDSGDQFTPLNHAGKNYFGYSISATDAEDTTSGQAPRDMDIAVSHTNADEVHIAGVNTWRSLDGGVTFNPSTNWSVTEAQSNNLGYSHADVDLLQFVGSTLYTTTDGGIFKATNSAGPMSTSYFTDISTGLGIRQFYAFGISQTSSVVITGGAQDNGSVTRTSGGVWQDWLGGDGMEGFVDKTNSQIIYGTTQNGTLSKSLDGGVTRQAINSPDGKSGNWVTPFEQDPVAVDVMYGGYNQVYKSTNQGDTWTPISQVFDSNLNQLKVAKSLPTTMYTAYLNKIYKTTTGSGTWTELAAYTGGYVNSLSIHPSDPNKVAVASADSGKVFITTDGGTTWTLSAYDLPNFSALAVVWDNNTNDGLYVGMDYGVYYLDNTTNNSWQPFVNNLPNVKVAELEVNYADNKLYVATYGRGVWRTPRYDINTLSSGDSVLAEALEQNITMYPNPATESFNIVSTKNETATIRVFNALGKLMHYSKDINLTNEFKVDISQYASGLYFVRINNENGVVTKKLMVK